MAASGAQTGWMCNSEQSLLLLRALDDMVCTNFRHQHRPSPAAMWQRECDKFPPGYLTSLGELLLLRYINSRYAPDAQLRVSPRACSFDEVLQDFVQTLEGDPDVSSQKLFTRLRHVRHDHLTKILAQCFKRRLRHVETVASPAGSENEVPEENALPQVRIIDLSDCL